MNLCYSIVRVLHKGTKTFPYHGIAYFQRTLELYIVVSPLLKTAPLTILEPVNGKVVLLTEGESISEPCIAKGFPYPLVTWLTTNKVGKHTGSLLTRAENNYETLPLVSSTLEIEEIVPELSGNYSCRAFPENNDKFLFMQSKEAALEVVVSSE